MPGGAMPSGVKAIGRYARWKGSPGTLKSWLKQTAGVGRTPWGERGLLRPTGLLTLPGEDWSPPGKRPRTTYMTNLDGLCQGGAEGEKYPKTTTTGKATKNKQKGSLEESFESLTVGCADGREER